MKARVRQDCRWNPVTAFGGQEFIKGEWRSVPEGGEAAAAAHPLLEVTSYELGVTSEEASAEGGEAAADKRKAGVRRGREQ